MVRARFSYWTRGGGNCAPYDYNVTLIDTGENTARRVVARVENLDTGTDYFLGAFTSQRRAIEGVFAQINGLLSSPALELIPYDPAIFEA